jgi:hypothetical protein
MWLYWLWHWASSWELNPIFLHWQLFLQTSFCPALLSITIGCTLYYLPQGWSLGACKMSLAEWAVCTCTLFMDCSKNGFHKTPLLALRLRVSHHIRACIVRIFKATICMMQIKEWGKGNKRPTPCAELQLLLECLWTQKADARICSSRSIKVIDNKKISFSFLCKNGKKQNSHLWLTAASTLAVPWQQLWN